MKVRKAQDTDGFTQRRTGLQASGRGGSLPVESVAAFPWNGWQACHGISGSFRVERVAALPWNQWQDSPGIGGSFGVEYANQLIETDIEQVQTAKKLWLSGNFRGSQLPDFQGK